MRHCAIDLLKHFHLDIKRWVYDTVCACVHSLSLLHHSTTYRAARLIWFSLWNSYKIPNVKISMNGFVNFVNSWISKQCLALVLLVVAINYASHNFEWDFARTLSAPNQYAHISYFRFCICWSANDLQKMAKTKKPTLAISGDAAVGVVHYYETTRF